MRRKIALVLAAVVAAVSLVGCSDNKEPLNNSSESQHSGNNNSSTSQESGTNSTAEENYPKCLTIENNVVVKCDKEATEVVVPDGVTEIGEGAFSDCTNLKEVILPDGLTKMSPNIKPCKCQ